MTKEDLFKKIQKTLELPPDVHLDENSELKDYWDSLGQISMLSMLEKDFKIILKMDELLSLKKVRDVVGILENRHIKFEKACEK